ncbi:GIY-YIG nuclease family protein [Sphingomonas sp.]|uniref:GIY-YIG nuclease family protein n=1 Tax=Sphingomonas sp. TaxID=28214 RepID=UPI003D6D577A
MRERQPCVYLLSSGYNGRLYCGVTSNLIGRIQQHRDEVFDGFTKRYGIKRLVWFEVAETMEAAIAREKRIKKWPRDWKRNLIERDNPAWNDLAVGFGLPPLSGARPAWWTWNKSGVTEGGQAKQAHPSHPNTSSRPTPNTREMRNALSSDGE